MPVIQINSQPAANSLSAAYRPVVFNVKATATDGAPVAPVVYCDIYFGGVFYKSISKTQYEQLNANDTDWQFDIQDAAQEYLTKLLGPNGGSDVVSAFGLITSVQCKFRASGYDSNGFIKYEGIAPIQATGSSPAVPGDGLASNNSFAINSTLQHEDNQDVTAHLNALKKGTWRNDFFPLTHRPSDYYIGNKDSDYWPLIVDESVCLGPLRLIWKTRPEAIDNQTDATINYNCTVEIVNFKTTQAPNTQNVTASWSSSGDPVTGYTYRIDGGAWLTTSTPSLLFASMSIGAHTLEIAGLCACGQAEVFTYNFNVVSVADNSCTSTISALTFTQTTLTSGGLTFTTSGGATKWRMVVDGGTPIILLNPSYTIENLSLGAHTVLITPICANGVNGTPSTLTFTVYELPTFGLDSETIVSNHKVQGFSIGANVRPGNRFVLTIWGVSVTYTAVSGNTNVDVATHLVTLVNAKTAADWNAANAAPSIGTEGFPPGAGSLYAALFISVPLYNGFVAQAFIS